MSFEYSFSASAAVRALETTQLVYAPPTPPGKKSDVQPLILQVFDRPVEVSVHRSPNVVVSELGSSEPSMARTPAPPLPAGLSVLALDPAMPRQHPLRSIAVAGSSSTGHGPHASHCQASYTPASHPSLSSSRAVRFSTPPSQLETSWRADHAPPSGTIPSGPTIEPSSDDRHTAQYGRVELAPSAFTRQFRTFRSGGTVKLEGKDEGTAWFESNSSSRIQTPPDFSDVAQGLHLDRLRTLIY
ncbi:hypothetical protein BV20DRAFT_1058088 [Pilatotrama ljubarskyi]|nr:hypothetical protein BV20DRAFT_1058088 [Pilatotrama ljubarskyi]